MGLKIWKPTCPSCGGGLNIQKGEMYIQCENCGSNLIIEGWKPEMKPLDLNGNSLPDEYGMTGTFAYYGDPPVAFEGLPDYSFEYGYPRKTFVTPEGFRRKK